MTTNPDMLVHDLSHMQISNYAPQQYSPTGKKIGPVVPPKPKNEMYSPIGMNPNGAMYEAQAARPQVPVKSSNTGGPIYSNINDLPLPPPPPPAPSGQMQQHHQPSGQMQQHHQPSGQMQQHHQPSYATAASQSSGPQVHPQISYSPPIVQKYAMPLPPPSPPDGSITGPAGSSYDSQSGYATFRPQSSASSYDTSSIYEPITPRPPSQMSNRSNYSVGSGGGSLYSSYYPRSKTGAGGQSSGKEAEVDRLTDLMVQNLENSGDPDFYGMCYRCGEKVLGEGSGCTAMDHVYHIACFTCYVCYKELRGKPFYAKDGKPYCEEDYLNTLEKCCVCGGRILDRILRATGKPFHPNCFTCVVCHKCLDGIPFTVDATNQIYCINDFHKKFAPRCCVCMQPIMPEPGKEETVRVVALDRSFHVQCYCCEDCGLRLSSDAENSCYPLDDHILCRSCNAKRVQLLTSSIITEL